MKKVNIREALLDMDKQTYCKYDLYTLYEACNLQECDKKEIAKMISDDKSPEEIYDKLVDKFSDSVTTTDDDDISDVKESFGDDLIDSQYLDDTSDGHWSWDYDDDELANIYGGDTKYDKNPDGLDIDEYDQFEECLSESDKTDTFVTPEGKELKSSHFVKLFKDAVKTGAWHKKFGKQGELTRVEIENANKRENRLRMQLAELFGYSQEEIDALEEEALSEPITADYLEESQNTDLHKGNSITEDTSDRTSTDFSWSKGWCDCGAKDVFPHMLFATDAGTVFREGPYGYRLRGEVFAENPNIFHAYVMKYTDNSEYASHGQGGKTVVGKENLDSLEAAKAFIEDWFINSFDSYVNKRNESLTEGLSPKEGDRVRMDHYSKLNNGQEGTITGRIGELCWVTWDDGTKSKEIKGYLTVIERDGKVVNESETNSRYYKMIEYTYDGDNVSDYLGHVRVRTNSDKVALRAAEKYAMSKHPEDNPRNFKICDDNYTNVDVIDSDGDYLTTLESVDESKQIGLSLSEKLERIDDLFEQSLKHIGFGYEEVYSLDYATANKLIDQFITYLDAENIDLSYKSEITPLGVKVGGNSTGIAHNYVYNLVKSEWRLMSQAETQQLLSDMSDTRKLDQYLNENLYHYYEQDRYGFCKRIDTSRFLNLANKQSGSRFIGQGSQMSMLDTKVKIYEHNGPGYNFKINVSTLTYDSLQRENKFGIKKNTSDEEDRQSDILTIKSNIKDNLVLDNYMGTGKSHYQDYQIELFHDSDNYGGYPWCYVISKDSNILTKKCYDEDLSNTLYSIAQFIYNTESKSIKEGIEIDTIANYITDHYEFDDIDDKYSCIDSIRDSFKNEKTISKEELEQFIGSHNGKDKVTEGIDGWDNRTGVIKRIDKYLYDNPEAIPPKGYIQPGSRAYDDAVSRYGDYVTTPFGNISTDDLMQYARDNKLLDESKYTSNLIGPDNLLMNAEEAYFDGNLGDFVADTLNDGSATEEELLAVTEKSSFIEYDDMLNAIDYAKSLNESFDISWNGNKIATSANKNLCESVVKKALKASSTPDLVIESAGKNVTNKFIRSIVESQDIREGTSLKRIARYNEFDNGNVLHNYEKMTSEEAEERAKQASIDNPDDIYYVAYDDIMDSSSDLRWINGKSYNYSDVQIKGGKPYIKDASANESIENTSIEDIDKFVAEVKEKFPGSEAIYDGDTNTIKITLDNVQKENLTEDSTESDELETADQKISSANTSINSSKLPAIFRLVKFEPDTLNLDYGGGKFDNAAEYLAQQNVTNLVYDPYNRSTQHNAEVLQKVRENGGADSITISNVLNVIAEPEARLTVLRNAKKLVKPGGNVYITVYEGNKSGEGTETKSGYQLNKSTADYIDEIASVFSTVNRKGKLIIAK